MSYDFCYFDVLFLEQVGAVHDRPGGDAPPLPFLFLLLVCALIYDAQYRTAVIIFGGTPNSYVWNRYLCMIQ
jgi:hypothetical protein